MSQEAQAFLSSKDRREEFVSSVAKASVDVSDATELQEFFDNVQFSLAPKGNLRRSADHDTELIDAIMSGDIARVEGLLASGPRLDIASSFFGRDFPFLVNLAERYLAAGPSGVQQAASETARSRTAEALAQRIFAQKMSDLRSPELVNGSGRNALTAAVASGKEDMLEAVLGCSGMAHVKHVINTQDSAGATPLCLACEQGSLECVKMLLAYGADANAANVCGESPIFSAVRSKDAEALVLNLVEHGADVNYVSKNGRTALAVAVALGDVSKVRLLLEMGSSVYWRHEGSLKTAFPDMLGVWTRTSSQIEIMLAEALSQRSGEVRIADMYFLLEILDELESNPFINKDVIASLKECLHRRIETAFPLSNQSLVQISNALPGYAFQHGESDPASQSKRDFWILLPNVFDRRLREEWLTNSHMFLEKVTTELSRAQSEEHKTILSLCLDFCIRSIIRKYSFRNYVSMARLGGETLRDRLLPLAPGVVGQKAKEVDCESFVLLYYLVQLSRDKSAGKIWLGPLEKSTLEAALLKLPASTLQKLAKNLYYSMSEVGFEALRRVSRRFPGPQQTRDAIDLCVRLLVVSKGVPSPEKREAHLIDIVKAICAALDGYSKAARERVLKMLLQFPEFAKALKTVRPEMML